MRRIATTSMARVEQQEAKAPKPAQEAVLIKGPLNKRPKKRPRDKRPAVTGSRKANGKAVNKTEKKKPAAAPQEELKGGEEEAGPAGRHGRESDSGAHENRGTASAAAKFLVTLPLA
jgi:hypothetical protein